MKILKLFILISAILPVLIFAQPKESMCKEALEFQEYATLGDCYRYGVSHEKNLGKAKIYYLYGAMRNSGDGEYGKLQAANMLLFRSDSALENAMGLYILKDFSDREDVEKVVQPKYAGNYTRRGSARYMLAIYFAQKGDFESAKNYLEKALEDNQGQAAFALIYLDEAKKFAQPLGQKTIDDYMKVGMEKQQKYFFWGVKDYPCWLERKMDQSREDVPFPVEAELIKRLQKKYGACSNYLGVVGKDGLSKASQSE